MTDERAAVLAPVAARVDALARPAAGFHRPETERYARGRGAES